MSTMPVLEKLHMKKESSLSGILIINKPAGITSRDVVNKVSRLLGTKKIGHTGTLDPLAEGVLILAIGKCTKLVDYLTCSSKDYVAEFALGFETDTLDITGKKTLESSKSTTESEIKKCIQSFKGHYLQEVPAYSAVKVAGKKMYEYARAGIEVELPKREVTIENIEVLSIEDSKVKIKARVSKGTYIRSLIRDIGRALGTYATMTSLQRIRQGSFDLESSYTIEDIENGNYKILSKEEILLDIPSIDMDEDMLKKVSNGVKLKLNKASTYVSFKYEGKIIALYENKDEFYRMYIKF